MEDDRSEQSPGLDLPPMQHVFSFLSPNDLVLSVKQLSKHFEQSCSADAGKQKCQG